jgi:hypothetical protein
LNNEGKVARFYFRFDSRLRGRNQLAEVALDPEERIAADLRRERIGRPA